MEITLVILALATWRMANMLSDTNQSGPFGILDKLRLAAGVRYDQLSVPYGTNGLSEGMLCIFCNSVWFGTGWMVLFLLDPIFAFYMALPFALSAAAILVEKLNV